MDEIIINGVDVSKCKYFKCCSKECSAEYYTRYGYEITEFDSCSENHNCYYKQLKRKEQECEGLKKNIEHWKMEHKEAKAKGEWTYDLVKKRLGQQLDQLKAENEELKTMLKDLSYENQKFCYQIEEQTKQLEPFKDEYFKELDNVAIAELAKKSIRITAENSKLEQTITDIKEIAEIEIECKTYEIENDCFNETRCKALNEHIEFIKQILQKISKCEVENVKSVL